MEEIRRANGKTISFVATELEVYPSTVKDWEDMPYPPLDRIEQFCNLFNVPLSVFVSSENGFYRHMIVTFPGVFSYDPLGRVLVKFPKIKYKKRK